MEYESSSQIRKQMSLHTTKQKTYTLRIIKLFELQMLSNHDLLTICSVINC